MALSNEVRRLQSRWELGTGWPKRLDWIEIKAIRGWTGQRFEVRFPIMAVVGQNGTGKSTVLQCAASVYTSPTTRPKERFASDFFPDTAWDQIRGAEIRYAVREAGKTYDNLSVRKPTGRWRGNPERRRRHTVYIDLSRIQPVPARVGYSKLANPSYKEASALAFEPIRLARLSAILGRNYDLAKMALTDADANRRVPVITQKGALYSGFHQGAGEITIAELLQADIPEYALVLIDEVESSLHPQAQRRLIRDLADCCRERQLQIILTTHSPYVMEELPPEARAYIMQQGDRREIVYGVSPEFAISKMDDVPQYECELYVEDERAGRMLTEILAARDPELVHRCQLTPYGAASVGKSLGQMVASDKFRRPTCVFLDGDRGEAPGCITLPGDDAPERVVFGAIAKKGWQGIVSRLGRSYPDVVDSCERAMALTDHHQWVQQAAARLTVGGENLWQALCAEWATSCLDDAEAMDIARRIRDRLEMIPART